MVSGRPSSAAAGSAGGPPVPTPDGDAGADAAELALAESLQRPFQRRWLPWHRQASVALVVLWGMALALLAQSLAGLPSFDAGWHTDAQGRPRLTHSALPGLDPLEGASLVEIVGENGDSLVASELMLVRSPRWALLDVKPARWLDVQRRLDALLHQQRLTLHFEGGQQRAVEPGPRGLTGLGALFWLCSAMAFCLGMVASVVLMVRCDVRNLMYLVMALCQAANLLLIGMQSLPGLGLGALVAGYSPQARTGLDLVTAGAFVHSVTLYPRRLPAGRWIAAAAWLGVATLAALAATVTLEQAWWAAQSGILACGFLVIGLLSWSYRIERNPHAVLMGRFALLAQGTLALMSVAALVASRALPQALIAAASVVWYLSLACLLLLLPFLPRARRPAHELAILAGACTLATSIDLVLLATTRLGPFATLTLSIGLALGSYVFARPWFLDPTSAGGMPGIERMFEHLYRMVREVEAQPQASAALLTRFLRDMFEPLDAQQLEQRPTRSRVYGDGAALLVPVPDVEQRHAGGVQGSVLLRFAARGKRMFTVDDARLTDRVVEQLRRAVAYDKAVERGRNEERARIAQDLHDDIGARLLTLMYKAHSPEMEDYVRHTLKDLKTLTRGLAAADHRLSHAAAEWKTDIAQRLGAAQIELGWSFAYDEDIVLSVVQWSALTRVLRELVSNVIQHSCATQLEISARLEGGRLRLSLVDDGIGRNPLGWAHGLGLGGVRKRVKLLGGDVHWRENGARGIACVVLVAGFEPRR